ncbi:FAD-binding oxidoreductase [Streptomyces sp. T-3]|nr:FAD-binding oxidoreductase [Streptomyces sp. T-3]
MSLAGGPPALGTPHWETLRSTLEGTLVLPGDSTYEVAKQLQKAEYDTIRPQAVAYCRNSSDVAACIRFCQDNGLACSMRSGGHCNAGYSTSLGLVIDVSRINGVRPTGSTVRLGAGGQGVDVVNALSPLGLQVISGNCPTVALGGFMTGGGIGLASRRFGLASDRLVSAQVVLANGKKVRASAAEHPDLFWALRGGGGGNFGVVTEFEVKPVRTPSITLFTLGFAWADAVDVIQGWQEWFAHAPYEISSELFIFLVTGQGKEPEVFVYGSYLGAKAQAEQAMDNLLAAVGRPHQSRAVDELPYQQAMMRQYGCGDMTVDECHRVGYSPRARLPRQYHDTYRNAFFSRPMDRYLIADAVDRMETSLRPGQLRSLGFLPAGGRINDCSPTATAYVHRESAFLFQAGIALTADSPAEADKDAGTAWLNGLYSAIEPHSNHGVFQNFKDPALTNWQQAYYGQNYARLQHVRRAYDPYRFFAFPQAVS